LYIGGGSADLIVVIGEVVFDELDGGVGGVGEPIAVGELPFGDDADHVTGDDGLDGEVDGEFAPVKPGGRCPFLA